MKAMDPGAAGDGPASRSLLGHCIAEQVATRLKRCSPLIGEESDLDQTGCETIIGWLKAIGRDLDNVVSGMKMANAEFDEGLTSEISQIHQQLRALWTDVHIILRQGVDAPRGFGPPSFDNDAMPIAAMLAFRYSLHVSRDGETSSNEWRKRFFAVARLFDQAEHDVRHPPDPGGRTSPR
jgi:hypothetical protein